MCAVVEERRETYVGTVCEPLYWRDRKGVKSQPYVPECRRPYNGLIFTYDREERPTFVEVVGVDPCLIFCSILCPLLAVLILLLISTVLLGKEWTFIGLLRPFFIFWVGILVYMVHKYIPIFTILCKSITLRPLRSPEDQIKSNQIKCH